MPVALTSPEERPSLGWAYGLLTERAHGGQASIETGQFDEAAPKAAELNHALREHVLLIDGVLEALIPDDISPGKERR